MNGLEGPGFLLAAAAIAIVGPIMLLSLLV